MKDTLNPHYSERTAFVSSLKVTHFHLKNGRFAVVIFRNSVSQPVVHKRFPGFTKKCLRFFIVSPAKNGKRCLDVVSY